MLPGKLKFVPVFCLLIVALVVFNPAAEASDIEFEVDFDDEFEDFVTEIGSSFSYIPAAPSRSRGIIGWDVGVDISTIDISGEEYMDKGFGGSAPSYAFLPRLRASKGLPGDLDVSGFVTQDPKGNAQLLGGSLKYAFISGGTFLTDLFFEPSAAVRLHGTQLSGVDDLGLFTYGADVSASLSVPFLTPYAGVSHVQIEGEDNSDLGFDDVSTDDQRYFVGAAFSLGLIDFVGEANYGETDIYTVRGNIGF